MERTRTRLLRFRLRGLLIANVFLSLPMAAAAYAIRLEGSARVYAGMAGALIVPILQMAMTVALVRPGPGRDAIRNGFMVALILGLLAVGLLMAGDFGSGLPRRRLERVVVTAVGVFYFGMLLTLLCRRVAVRRCPSCGRPGLIESFQTNNRGPSPLHPQSPVLHAWCLSCRRRLRRPRRLLGRQQPWVDASGPDQDENYWLTPPLLFRPGPDPRPPT